MMDEKLREQGYALLMELAKDPDYLISLAKIGAKARESGEKLKQALATEPRFYVGQPVLVEDRGGDTRRGYFQRYQNNTYVISFDRGADGYQYDNCKPDPNAVSLPNWQPAVASEIVNADANAEAVVWTPDNKYFALIPLPDFID